MATTAARAHPYSDSRRGGCGGQHQRNSLSSVICKYWLAGRCTRYPCRFSHHSPTQQQYQPNTSFRGRGGYGPIKASIEKQQQQPASIKTDDISQSISKRHPEEADIKATAERFDENRVCAQWMSGSCVDAEKCRFMHSWVSSMAKTGIDRIAQLNEHKKDVTGIVLPSGSNILYTGSIDGTLRAWDANTGKCIDFINVGAEVGCIICEGPWVFVGLPNAIWAWNIETSQRLSLAGPVGQVYAMVVNLNHNTLYSACEDGNIIAYKPCPEEMTFRLAATLKGHRKAVLSFAVSKFHVFSGSEDCTIRCWDLHTFQCLHILEGHSAAVASLICWDCYLFSGSLDKTIRVWARTEDHGIKEIHTCKQEQGVIAFMGMTDAAEKPVIFASCDDNSVRMYEMSSERCLMDRGRLFSKNRVTTISFSGGQVFTGYTSGNVDVWKWLATPET